jgi:histidinol-phosphatase (PHP family)
MLPPDNHVHSEWSWDTYGASMDASCAQAVQAGLPAVAFTEHVDFTSWGGGDGLPDTELPGLDRPHVHALDVEGYLASVERCRDRYPDLRIRTGIETGEPHLFAGSVAAVLAQGDFERVLGSLHSLVHDGRLVGVDVVLTRRPPEQVAREWFTELLALVEGSSVFEVLAHADFPRRYWPAGEAPFDEAVFEDEYRAVFRELASSGRVLEMNTRSPMWSVELLSWWRDEGGRAVSFGSDAHLPWRVGALFDEAVAVVEAAGFRPGRDRFDFWRR